MLFIGEYASLAQDARNQPVGAPIAPGVAYQKLEPGLESIQSDPFNVATRFIDIYTTDGVCLSFGPDPIAEDGFFYVGPGEYRVYGVNPGQKLAAIAAEF